MDDDTAQVAYDASIRLITGQEATLDNLRSRAGTLLTANAIVAAFLGAAALKDEPALVEWKLAGAALFVGAAVGAVVVLLPAYTWRFALSLDDVERIDAERGGMPLRQAIAKRYDSYCEKNSCKLNNLMWLFIVAAALVVAQAVAWLVALA